MICCGDCKSEFQAEGASFLPYVCPGCGCRTLGSTYVELSWIGGGGMGDVYRARQPEMGNRLVAIKIPRESTPQFQIRFEREIAASALLQHENIVRAFDRGAIEGRPYLIMEFIEGRSLRHIVEDDGPLGQDRVARVLRGVGSGLAHAESRGIINRDIKPDNILLTTDDCAKILDYGLAKLPMRDGDYERMTREGVLLGTPAFMSPEQYRDPHSVTIQSDVFSLGCTAFFALTRVLPFSESGFRQMLEQRETHPPSTRDSGVHVDAALDELLQRMMSVVPENRPTPRQIMQLIERLLPALPMTIPALGDFSSSGDSAFPDEDDGVAFVGQVIEDTAEHDVKTWPTTIDRRDPYPPAMEPADDEVVFEGTVVEVSHDRFSLHEQSDALVLPEVVQGQEIQGPEQPSAVENIPVLPAAAVWSGGQIPLNNTSQRGTNHAGGDVAVLPSAAIVKPPQVVREVEKPVPARPHQLSERDRFLRFVAIAGGTLGLIVLMAVGAFLVQRFTTYASAKDEWTAALSDYDERKFKLASRKFAEFAKTHGGDAHAADVPFFLDLCTIGPDVFSQTGDTEKALAAIEDLFQNYRDTPQYEAYRAEFYKDLQRLVERNLESSDKTGKTNTLADAAKAYELLSTVANSMPDDWVPREKQKIAQKIADASARQAELKDKKELLGLLREAHDSHPATDHLDSNYAQVKKLLQHHPKLNGDKDVKDALVHQYDGEVSRVRYVNAADEDTGSESGEIADRDRQHYYVVWDEPGGPRVAGGVHLTLIRGVLYAFDSNGNHVWSRRLGVDSERMPIAIDESPAAVASFIAVSPRDNSLVALAQSTGQLLWKYTAGGQQLTGPLTVTRWRSAPNRPDLVRGLVPTAAGEIHVLELDRGKRIGKFETGSPLSMEGTFDSELGLAFFAADSQRVLAIDPAAIDDPAKKTPAARAVLFSRHASGALRSPPLIVGQYLILTETADLESTTIRVFEIKPRTIFPRPDASPLKEVRLRGWSWFTPPSAPDRITVATDAGDFGVFGFNLDNPAESIYPIIASSSTAKPPLMTDSFRALAVQADEYFLWLMSGGRLRSLAIDLLHQRWRVLWPKADQPAEIVGMPVHEATLDRYEQRIYIATRATNRDESHFAAVNAETGKQVWQRQIGVSPARDPLVFADHAVVIDRTGRLLELRTTTDGEELTYSTERVAPRSSNGPLLWAPDLRTNSTAASPSGALVVAANAEGTDLLVRRLGSQGGDDPHWQEVSLPGVRLQGRPAILKDSLMVPGSDGRLHRLPLKENEQPFAWKTTALGPNDQAMITPLSEKLLLCVNGREARWLELTDSGNVRYWKQIGPTILGKTAFIGEAVATADYVFLADEKSLYRIPRNLPTADPSEWNVEERITGGPFAVPSRPDLVFVITQGRTILCFSTAQEAGAPPVWQATSPARLCGQPTDLGKYLLVTEESGRVSGVRLTDGQVAGEIELGEDRLPAAAAVRLGDHRILVPLADGTILWQSLRPAPKNQASEKTL